MEKGKEKQKRKEKREGLAAQACSASRPSQPNRARLPPSARTRPTSLPSTPLTPTCSSASPDVAATRAPHVSHPLATVSSSSPRRTLLRPSPDHAWQEQARGHAGRMTLSPCAAPTQPRVGRWMQCTCLHHPIAVRHGCHGARL